MGRKVVILLSSFCPTFKFIPPYLSSYQFPKHCTDRKSPNQMSSPTQVSVRDSISIPQASPGRTHSVMPGWPSSFFFPVYWWAWLTSLKRKHKRGGLFHFVWKFQTRFLSGFLISFETWCVCCVAELILHQELMALLYLQNNTLSRLCQPL